MAAAGARPEAVALFTIALDALAAADRPVPVEAVAARAVLLGPLNGGIQAVELARTRAGLPPEMGAACSIFVPAAPLAGNVVSRSARAARAAGRVDGSGIAASGLRMAGRSLRGA